MRRFIKILTLLAGLLLGHAALANPVICSPGYQDSTCFTPIRSSGTPAPTCPSAAGYTTTAAAVWQGYHWSQPSCAYQAAQTCPPGTTTQTASMWTGSAWTQPVCNQPVALPPPVNPTTQAAACGAVIDSWRPYASVYPNQYGAFSDSLSLSAISLESGWVDFTGVNPDSMVFANNSPASNYSVYTFTWGTTAGWGNGAPGYEMFVQSAVGSNTLENYLVCGVQQGTNNVVGVGFFYTTDGGNGGGGEGAGAGN